MPESEVIRDNHFDEQVDISDAESVPDNRDESDVSDAEDNHAARRGAAGQQSNEESIEFGDEDESRDDGSPGKKVKPKVVENQQYDEAVDISSSESVDESYAPPAPAPKPAQGAARPKPAAQSLGSTSGSAGGSPSDGGSSGKGGGSVGAKAAGVGAQRAHIGSGDEDEDNSATSSDEEEEEEGHVQATQGYNPADYANLQVSNEVKELFSYIARYKPQTIELETKLKPFIPDYVPAIGEIDPFLKIPRPDGQPDKLGLTMLDEPAAVQTDPTVLDLQLRAISTQAALQPTVVPSIENAAQNPQKITTWMQNMAQLHRGNPAPKVDYTKAMPDLEQLMQMWSAEMEEAFENTELPTANLHVDTKAFARIVCALLDIPVYTSLTESLHVLFTLYSEFKMSNQDALLPGFEGL